MDQGQASIDPFNWLENQYNAVLQTGRISTYRSIAREVQYDPTSVLQIEESESTHVPQGQLVQLDPVVMTIEPKFMSYNPFLFPSRLYENIEAQPRVFMNNNVLFDLTYSDITELNLALWARTRVTQELIRESEKYTIYSKIEYEFPQESTFRQQEWILCAEAVRNFNPLRFKELDLCLKTMRLSNVVNVGQIQAIILGVLAAYGMNFYAQFIQQYEMALLNPNPKSIQNTINTLANNLYVFVRKPSNTQLLVSQKLNCMILWLTIPHISGSNIMCPKLDYITFALAIIIVQDRIPKDEEWIARQNKNPMPGIQDPTYYIVPTSVDFLEPL